MRRLVFFLLALVLVCTMGGCAQTPDVASASAAPGQDFTGVPSVSTPPHMAQLSYRAMWISYLEWGNLHTESEAAFTQDVQAMMANCAALGLNCVIVQVRPFGDAIYPSSLFPWSHIVTGSQGQAPGYDPLAIFVREAHAQGLVLEAWINPYRVRLSNQVPDALSPENPALVHEGWAVEAADGLYYNPALPEVRDYIVQGVQEILQHYDVDGIQFDDYFYPTTEEGFDAQAFATGNPDGLSLDAWRRQNVNTLVQAVYAAIKQTKPQVVFGISPQGNNDNNYNGQYSDVALWMSQPGYVDYIMPQVYWGYGYTLSSGSDRFAFEKITAEWAAMPRDASVSLAFGLGAYRVGGGDGGGQDQTQWSSGHNLADMVRTLASMQGVGGFGVYRYDSLYHSADYAALTQAEQAALTEALH